MTPSPFPFPLSPPWEGTGQAGWPWKSTKQGHKSGGQVGPRKPPTSEARGRWAQPPVPTPFPPRSSPPHTLHLQGNLVLHAGAIIFLGGGRREGQPLGNPLPGALLKMVQTLPGQPPRPLPTRTSPPTSAAVQLVPKHEKPQAGFGHMASRSPRPPPIPHGWDPFGWEHPPPAPPPPPLGIVLLLSWKSSTHLPIRPSTLDPS